MNSYEMPSPLGALSRYQRGWKQGSNQTFAGMACALERDEHFLQTALALIRSGDDKSMLLIQALGSARSRQSQEALNTLTREALPGAPFRSACLRSLSDCFEPTPETVETHLLFLDDVEIGEQAQMGLGRLAHTLVRRHEWARAEELVDVLLERLRSATDIDQLIRGLRALGQAGHPAATDDVYRYLNHSEARIRLEAVGALQWSPGDAVETSLVGKALADGCETVRKKAVAVLGQRAPSQILIEGLKRVAKTDPVTDVRCQAMCLLTSLSPLCHDGRSSALEGASTE